MQNAAMRCAVVMAVLAMTAAQGLAVYHYNDGGNHIITWAHSEYVLIDFNKPGMNTSVIFDSGSAITGDYDLYGYQDCQILLNGGVLNHDLNAYNNTEVTIQSGSINHVLYARDNSVINLYGGTVAAISLLDDAELYVYGVSYALNGMPVDPGQTLKMPDTTVTISVTFADGNTLDYEILFRGPGQNSVALMIPEPATLGLLALGGLTLLKRRRVIR
jgi:hypothetical protein